MNGLIIYFLLIPLWTYVVIAVHDWWDDGIQEFSDELQKLPFHLLAKTPRDSIQATTDDNQAGYNSCRTDSNESQSRSSGDLQACLDESKTECDHLRTHLGKSQAECDDLRRQFSKLQGSYNNLQALHDNLQDSLTEVEALASAQKEDIDSLDSTKSEYFVKIVGLDCQVHGQQRKLKKLEQSMTLEENRKRIVFISEQTVRNKFLEKIFKAEKAKHLTTLEDKTRLSRELETVIPAYRQSQKHATDAQSQLRLLKSQAEKDADKIQSLESQLVEGSKSWKVHSLTRKLAEASKKVTALEAVITQLETEKETAERKLRRVEGSLARESYEHRSLQSTSWERNRELSLEKNRYRQRLHDCQADLQRKQEQLDQCKVKLEEAKVVVQIPADERVQALLAQEREEREDVAMQTRKAMDELARSKAQTKSIQKELKTSLQKQADHKDQLARSEAQLDSVREELKVSLKKQAGQHAEIRVNEKAHKKAALTIQNLHRRVRHVKEKGNERLQKVYRRLHDTEKNLRKTKQAMLDLQGQLDLARPEQVPANPQPAIQGWGFDPAVAAMMETTEPSTAPTNRASSSPLMNEEIKELMAPDRDLHMDDEVEPNTAPANQAPSQPPIAEEMKEPDRDSHMDDEDELNAATTNPASNLPPVTEEMEELHVPDRDSHMDDEDEGCAATSTPSLALATTLASSSAPTLVPSSTPAFTQCSAPKSVPSPVYAPPPAYAPSPFSAPTRAPSLAPMNAPSSTPTYAPSSTPAYTQSSALKLSPSPAYTPPSADAPSPSSAPTLALSLGSTNFTFSAPSGAPSPAPKYNPVRPQAAQEMTKLVPQIKEPIPDPEDSDSDELSSTHSEDFPDGPPPGAEIEEDKGQQAISKDETEAVKYDELEGGQALTPQTAEQIRARVIAPRRMRRRGLAPSQGRKSSSHLLSFSSFD